MWHAHQRPSPLGCPETDALILHVVAQANAIDSNLIFEPPNYLINTTSKIEWWAVANPVEGLRVLGLDEYPKEQRQGSPTRKLYHPKDFMPIRNEVNGKLQEVGEPSLQLSGFLALRAYTGPLYLKVCATTISYGQLQYHSSDPQSTPLAVQHNPSRRECARHEGPARLAFRQAMHG